MFTSIIIDTMPGDFLMGISANPETRDIRRARDILLLLRLSIYLVPRVSGAFVLFFFFFL